MLMVNAFLGERPINLVIDTGASHSCLSKKLVKNLTEKKPVKADIVVGIGRGLLKNKLVNVPNFRIGDLEICDYMFLILPLAHINKILLSIDLDPIDGFLGSDILHAHKATIDYGNKKMTLLKGFNCDKEN
jgi:predicted aspartyl protease